MTYLAQGGYAMWVVVMCGIIVALITVQALRKGTGEVAPALVLLWGATAMAVGFMGTLIGVSNVALAMSEAGADVPTASAWEGMRIALSTTVVGTSVFLVALAAASILGKRARTSARPPTE